MLANLRWYRYVWSELLPPTALGLLLWTFLLLMNAFFVIAEKALAKNLGWELTFEMVLYEIPKLLVMSIPMSVLLGCLIGIGRLSADHEWVALQSAGHGPGRILRPLLAFGLAAAAVGFGVYMVLVPRASYASRNLRGEAIFLQNLASDLRPGAFYTQLPGTVLFVDNIRAGSAGRLEGVMIHRAKARGDFDEMILARTGDLYPMSGEQAGKLAVVLQHGVAHRYDPADPEKYQRIVFESHSDLLPTPPFLEGLLEAPSKSVLDMGPVDLWNEARDARDDTSLHPAVRAVRLRTVDYEIHRRLALPLASTLFAFLALPLGITRARSGKGAGFAVSLLISLIYWVVFTLAQARAVRGGMPPWVGAWSATFVLLPWGLIGYWRLRRSRGGDGWVVASRDAVIRAVARLGSRRRPASAPAAGDPEGDAEYADTLSGLGGTTHRFIGRLDQYVGLRFVRLLVLTLGAAFLVHGIVDLKRLLEGVFKTGQPMAHVLRYYVYALPEMFNLALPVSCMIGAIITFTLLTRTGELTAIKASGISMRRAMAPVLLLTVIGCGVLFLVQNKVTPGTSRKAEEVRDQILGRAPITYGMPAGGKWAFGPHGARLYHYRLYDPDRQLFQGLSIFTLDRSRPRVLEHRFSTQASWDGERWALAEGWRYAFPADDSDWRFEETPRERTARLDPPENFTRREAVLSSRGSGLQQQLSLEELAEQIETLGDSGYDTTRLEVAYWGKLAQPLSPLVMVLLGLPFAFRIGRRGSLYGIGVAILLVIVYWATFAVFNALGLETILPPMLAAWAPNVLYSLLGVYLILYINT